MTNFEAANLTTTGGLMRSARYLCAGLVCALITATNVAAQGGTPPPGRAVSTNYLASLDFAATPIGDFPTSITMLEGVMEVVNLNGQHMLRASAPSAFLIRLPSNLPTDFTVEVDLVPKLSGNENDFGLEGTPTINQGTASAYLLWQSEYLRVIGGDVDNFETKVPDALAVSTQGVLTRVTVVVQGTTMKVYTNGRLLSTLSNRRFVRGPVLRVFLGGQDDGSYAVHLAALRISPSALSATAVAVASNPLPPAPNAPSGGGAPAAQPGTVVTTMAPTTGTGMTASGASGTSTTGTTITTIAPTTGTGMTTSTSSSTTPSPSHAPATNKTTTSNVPVLGLSVGPRQGWGADISWPTFPGTVQHILERREAGQAFATLGAFPDNTAGNFKADLTVRNGTHYDYQVKAVDGNGTILAVSAIQGIDTPAQYPTVANLAASVGTAQTVNVTQAGQVTSAQGALVTYTWDASPFIGNQFATLEHITTDAAGQTTTVRSWNMLHNVQPGAQFGVAAGTSAQFCVAAVPDPNDATNLAGPSCITTAVLPTSRTTTNTRAANILNVGPAPTVTLTPTPGGIKVSYSMVTGAQNYSICRESPPGGACTPIQIPGVSVLNNTVTAWDLGLSPTMHGYRVTATQANGQYGESATLTAVAGALPTPQNVRVSSVSVAPYQVTLQWDPVQYEDYQGMKTIGSYQLPGGSTWAAQTVTGTQLTIPLSSAQAKYDWQISAVMPAPNGTALTSAPASVSYTTRYRLVVLGFWAHGNTSDVGLLDGAGDEVYLTTAVNVTDRSLSSSTVTTTRSSTFGDVAGRPNRIQAGTLTATGGLKSYNPVPNPLDLTVPVNLAWPQFPYQLWEGALDNQGMVVVHTTVWEEGTSNHSQLAWVRRAAALAQNAYAGSTSVKTLQALQTLRDANDIGPATGDPMVTCVIDAASRLAPDNCLPGEDRPIGLIDWGDNRRWSDRDQFVVLTHDAIERALGTSFTVQPIITPYTTTPPQAGAGVLIVNFRDSRRAAPFQWGDYSLYLKVERVP